MDFRDLIKEVEDLMVVARSTAVRDVHVGITVLDSSREDGSESFDTSSFIQRCDAALVDAQNRKSHQDQQLKSGEEKVENLTGLLKTAKAVLRNLRTNQQNGEEQYKELLVLKDYFHKMEQSKQLALMAIETAEKAQHEATVTRNDFERKIAEIRSEGRPILRRQGQD